MPVYEYHCARCGVFAAMTAMSARNEPQHCPGCAARAPRVIVTAPAFAGMPSAKRAAHGVNERAASEPRRSAEQDACHAGRSAGGVQEATGHKTFAGRRPWMIGH